MSDQANGPGTTIIPGGLYVNGPGTTIIPGGLYVNVDGFWVNGDGLYTDKHGKVVTEPVQANQPKPDTTPAKVPAAAPTVVGATVKAEK